MECVRRVWGLSWVARERLFSETVAPEPRPQGDMEPACHPGRGECLICREGAGGGCGWWGACRELRWRWKAQVRAHRGESIATHRSRDAEVGALLMAPGEGGQLCLWLLAWQYWAPEGRHSGSRALAGGLAPSVSAHI